MLHDMSRKDVTVALVLLVAASFLMQLSNGENVRAAQSTLENEFNQNEEMLREDISNPVRENVFLAKNI